MLYILHPSHANWFYEFLASKISDELRSCGIDTQLITAAEFVQSEFAGPPHDLLIVNLSECACTAGGPGYAYGDLDAMRKRLSSFRRRILLTLDCINTHWFSEQLQVAAGTLTDIFDLCMVPQLKSERIAGCRYVWIPESFSEGERRQLYTDNSERTIPWAMIGHQTPGRSALVDELVRTFSSQGLVFLPGLRPYSYEGSRNFSPEAINRILRKSRFYIWTSHHAFPYHEGLRALHAVQNGCAPVKICPTFAAKFQQLPWVFPSVSTFIESVERTGWQNLALAAAKFILDRGPLGSHLSAALRDPLQQRIIS